MMSKTVTVKIEINGVVYPVSCMTGEEDRLIKSSKEVNKVIASLSNISETIGETRLLAMTSLILADKLIEQENSKDESNNMNELVNWLEKATERMNKVAKLLENKYIHHVKAGFCVRNFNPWGHKYSKGTVTVLALVKLNGAHLFNRQHRITYPTTIWLSY